jgi:hypothetical protein
MSELNDKDWEQVNAYHDGALSASEMRALETRLAAEPALAAALEDVRRVSRGLALMRPVLDDQDATPQTSAANSNRHPRPWLWGGAVAAAVALAMVFGSGFVASPTAFDIHSELAAQTYDLGSGDLRPVAGGGLAGVPDLEGANLTAVASRVAKQGDIMHYAGQNGCRLTYLRGGFALPEGKSTSEKQIASWGSRDQQRHIIVATGMDRTRFDAIARYLRLETRERASESVMAALSKTVRSARPCVG